MSVNRVYLDDILLYAATAAEYGEDGEIVDVYCPAVPAHARKEVGNLVQVRLGYSECEEERCGVMRFISVAESLFPVRNDAPAIIRLEC